MTQYKTEKRRASVGERILITNDEYSFGYYENGDVVIVSSVFAKGVKGEGDGWFILHNEYEVIVGEHTPTPNLDEMNFDELIALSEAVMKEIKTRHEQGRYDADIEVAHGTYEKSDQQKRDEIVEKAKKDVEELIAFDYMTTVDFIVNIEKRTVVSLRKFVHILGRGIAKCAPNDCFNAHIGKAIALRRALGLEVLSEYLNVPQPTEVRVGDVVETTFLNGETLKFTVERIENGRAYRNDVLGTYVRLDAGRRYGYPASDPKTIDDSRAGVGE